MRTSLKIFSIVILPIFFLTGCGPKKIIPEKSHPSPREAGLQRGEGGEKNMELSGKKVLMVVAPVNFRDEELFVPKEILESAGAAITVTSRGVTTAQGSLGKTVAIDKDLTKVNSTDYDAIIFVGGPGTTTYFNDQNALDLAKSAFTSGKVVGAICIAPSILANSGILSGKKATAFPSEAGNLKAKGATYTGESVTVDGKIVTAKGPEAAKEFGEAIKNLLK